MAPITIITIVVIALLTSVILGLAWLAYASCLRMYKVEVDQGKHDAELAGRDRKHGKWDILGSIGSYALLAALLSLFIVGIVYRARGRNLAFGNQTALVIGSGSMSGFHDDVLAERYRELGYDASLQFGIGDVCAFREVSRDEELIEGEVYGYVYKDIIITHRLVGTYGIDSYEFRGDNNPVSDGPVARDRVIYRYTGGRAPGVGAFVLYAQSPFGIWSLAGTIGIGIGSEVVNHRIERIHRERRRLLEERSHEE